MYSQILYQIFMEPHKIYDRKANLYSERIWNNLWKESSETKERSRRRIRWRENEESEEIWRNGNERESPQAFALCSYPFLISTSFPPSLLASSSSLPFPFFFSFLTYPPSFSASLHLLSFLLSSVPILSFPPPLRIPPPLPPLTPSLLSTPETCREIRIAEFALERYFTPLEFSASHFMLLLQRLLQVPLRIKWISFVYISISIFIYKSIYIYFYIHICTPVCLWAYV